MELTITIFLTVCGIAAMTFVLALAAAAHQETISRARPGLGSATVLSGRPVRAHRGVVGQ